MYKAVEYSREELFDTLSTLNDTVTDRNDVLGKVGLRTSTALVIGGASKELVEFPALLRVTVKGR